MADGRTHFVSNVVMGIGVGYLVYNYIPDALPYAIVGMSIATIITPDMDLEGTTYTEHIMRRIPIIGLIFQISFYPYALAFVHRGWSHSWFIGTLTRVIWCVIVIGFWFIWIIGIAYLFDYFYNYQLQIQLVPLHVAIGIVFWYLEDWNHYTLDWLFSERKKRYRRHHIAIIEE